MLKKPSKFTTLTFLGHARPKILIFLNMAMQSVKVEVFEVTKKDAALSFHQYSPGAIIFYRTGPLFWYAGLNRTLKISPWEH